MSEKSNSRQAGAVRPPRKIARTQSVGRLKSASPKVPSRLNEVEEIVIGELKLQVCHVNRRQMASDANTSGVRVPGSVFYLCIPDNKHYPLKVRVMRSNGYNLSRLARLVARQLDIAEEALVVFQRLPDHEMHIVLREHSTTYNIQAARI